MKQANIYKTTSRPALLVCLMLLSAAASAAPPWARAGSDELTNHHIAYAKVVDVTPVYREVRKSVPVEECWQEPVTETRHIRHSGNTAGGTLAGGLIGGIIGHQIGKGRGQKLSTAVGTLIGAQLGHDAASGGPHASSQTYTRMQNFCEQHNQVSYEEVLDSYRVTYRYEGDEYRVNMPYDPGSKIKLKVSVEPVF